MSDATAILLLTLAVLVTVGYCERRVWTWMNRD